MRSPYGKGNSRKNRKMKKRRWDRFIRDMRRWAEDNFEPTIISSEELAAICRKYDEPVILSIENGVHLDMGG